MNRYVIFGVAMVAIAGMSGCTKGKTVEKNDGVKLVTTADTISYLVGHDIGNSMRSIKDEIIDEVVIAGIKDHLAGKTTGFSPEQERIIMQSFSMKMQEKQMAKSNEQASNNLNEAKKFLEENGKKEGVVTTPSGLQYSVVKKGDGPVPSDSSKVKVHYEGTLLSGKVFDSSIKRGQPAVFGVKQVIPGWTEALKLMNVGSKYKLFIHPDLAYGPRGMPHDIGPNTMLIFEIELIGIEK